MNPRLNIYLAALLHDIGKFYQRADIPPEKTEAESRSQAIFESLAAYYERLDSPLQKLVELAACWSSGIDPSDKSRSEAAGTQSQQTPNLQNLTNHGLHGLQLESLFSRIEVNRENSSKQDKAYGYELNALALSDNIFPQPITVRQSMAKDYARLWMEFCREFDQLPTDDQAFAGTLLALLRKYASLIPAGTHDMREVSLYEHLKSTAALALCLYDYQAAQPDKMWFDEGTKKWKFAEDALPVLMACVDIAGIQKFIYDIANRRAAVSLKGRSFYLQLLMDAVLQSLLDACGIFGGNVVYASGGKAYVLLPSTEKNRDEIKGLRTEIENWIFKEFKTTLYVCMDAVAFRYYFQDQKGKIRMEHEEALQDLGHLWKTLSERTSQWKSKKYKDLMTKNFSTFFEGEDPSISDKTATCAVTGETVEENDKNLLHTTEEGKLYVLPIVKQQIELGKKLKEATAIVRLKTANNHVRNADVVSILGYDYLIDSNKTLDGATRLTINDSDFLPQNRNKGDKTTYGFLFYGGNEQAMSARNKQDPKTFEDLVKGGLGEDLAFERLGVLRMDVDNLGSIFKSGLPEANKSFAAYATLSAQLDMYFAGYLNRIRGQDKYKDFVNILYAGGDDVFAVGRWDLLLDFAKEVRDQFRKFVCGREDISLSAGLALIDAKFPISKGADLAGEAEDAAKKHSPQKNALCVFGEVVSWHKEWDFVAERKADLVAWLEAGKITKGVLNQLMRFSLIKKGKPVRDKQTGEWIYLTQRDWMWLAPYYFAKRRKKADDKGAKAYNEVNDKLKTYLFAGVNENGTHLTNERTLELLAIAARWASLEVRAVNKANDEQN